MLNKFVLLTIAVATISMGVFSTAPMTRAVSGLAYAPLFTSPSVSNPVRVLDTRTGYKSCTTTADSAISLLAGEYRKVTVCGVPSSARAVSGNVTVVNPQTAGFATVSVSALGGSPSTANVTYNTGETVNGHVVVPLNDQGAFYIYSSSNADYVFDVSGFYKDLSDGTIGSAPAYVFHPLAKPSRMVDTRYPSTACDNRAGMLETNTYTAMQVRYQCAAGNYSGISGNARAVSGTITVVEPIADGYMSIVVQPERNYYTGETIPAKTASINFRAGQTISNDFIAALVNYTDTPMSIMVYTSARAHVVVDITGYYNTDGMDTTGVGMLFYPATPTRLVDTRAGQDSCYRGPLAGALLMGNQTWTLDVRYNATCAAHIPSTVGAVVGTITTLNQADSGFLRVIPDPYTVMPQYHATMTYARNHLVSSGAVIRVAGDGISSSKFFKLYSYATTDVIIDISGYFLPMY